MCKARPDKRKTAIFIYELTPGKFDIVFQRYSKGSTRRGFSGDCPVEINFGAQWEKWKYPLESYGETYRFIGYLCKCPKSGRK